MGKWGRKYWSDPISISGNLLHKKNIPIEHLKNVLSPWLQSWGKRRINFLEMSCEVSIPFHALVLNLSHTSHFAPRSSKQHPGHLTTKTVANGVQSGCYAWTKHQHNIIILSHPLHVYLSITIGSIPEPQRQKRYAVFPSHYLAKKSRICVREKWRIIYNLILN